MDMPIWVRQWRHRGSLPIEPAGSKCRSGPRLTGGPASAPERSAIGRPAGALARHLLARDERWQETYYEGHRSNVLRLAESRGRTHPGHLLQRRKRSFGCATEEAKAERDKLAKELADIYPVFAERVA
jgi:hypothetical protein